VLHEGTVADEKSAAQRRRQGRPKGVHLLVNEFQAKAPIKTGGRDSMRHHIIRTLAAFRLGLHLQISLPQRQSSPAAPRSSDVSVGRYPVEERLFSF
jgi:hypothetical protein